MAVIVVNDGNFEELVIENKRPALVDFWSPGCGPCQMISPLIEKLAEDFKGDVDIFKMNISENNDIPGGLGIRSVPTRLTFKNGDLVNTIVGAPPPQKLVDTLEALLDD